MLSEEIKRGWSVTAINYSTPIKSLENTPFKGWTFRTSEGYGIAIPYTKGTPVNESFAGVILRNQQVVLNGQSLEALELMTEKEGDILNPFSVLCAEFANPGPDGVFREKIVNNPELWWSEWKELLGNKNVDERVYDNLGEMVVLRYLKQHGFDAVWRGPEHATYDIDCGDAFYEVKSTQKREGRQITLNNSFRLVPPPGKQLYVMLCQFERAEKGETINSVLEDLVQLGYNRKDLENKLKKLGLEQGRSARDRAYVLHSIIKYPVNSKFPCIKDESFVGGKMPKNVISISYTVSLDGVDGEKIL